LQLQATFVFDLTLFDGGLCLRETGASIAFVQPGDSAATLNICTSFGANKFNSTIGFG